MDGKTFYIVIIALFASTCKSVNQEISDLSGNVYIHNSILEQAIINEDSAFPITAFKIERDYQDSILISYKIGREAYLKAMLISVEDRSYISDGNIKFSPNGADKGVCVFKFNDSISVISYNNTELRYLLSYKDELIHDSILSNPYYDEIGFSLFPKNLAE